jgi:phage terminase large subunit-like protein
MPTRSRSRRSARPSVPAWARKLFALLPGYDPAGRAAPGERFVPELAEHALRFFPEQLQFIEGERGGDPFDLEPWQRAIVACLFGWVRADGTRRYRESLIYVPRKNGKTPFCAGMVDLVMFTDGEPGAQIYSAAAEREQAALIFRHAAGMIARNPEMMRRSKIYRTFKSIEYPAEGSIYKALSSEADTKHGLGAHLIIVDELHAHRDGELVDVLKTSTAARRQPLVVYITTADYERESVCNRVYDYARKVRDGVVEDSSFLPAIWEASGEDDWTDPKVWAKANPNLGVSVKLDYLARECERARNEPTYENTFKRLHLNIRTQQDIRWLSVEKWAACNDPVDEAALAGRVCYAGLDLSTKVDLTAYVLVFPPTDDDPKWRVLPRFFAPEENAREREKKDRVPYQTWADQGHLTLTPGNVVDYDRVAAALMADAARFQIREVAYDPWNATHLALQLQAEGATMVEFRQGFGSMSEPTKELERLVISRELAHGGHPVLSWMASHVAVELDAAGNVKLSKRKSTERIDGLVCIVMGLGRAMVQPQGEPSIHFLSWGG